MSVSAEKYIVDNVTAFREGDGVTLISPRHKLGMRLTMKSVDALISFMAQSPTTEKQKPELKIV
jgi:hypothetical protein